MGPDSSPFVPANLSRLLPEVFAQRCKIREVTMAEASLNDGQTIHAVNDLFIGPESYTSARYQIAHRGRSERQSSSGVIVSTGLGSTGWFQSLMVGAASIDAQREGSDPTPDAKEFAFDWSERRLAFAVREPFPSRTTAATLVPIATMAPDVCVEVYTPSHTVAAIERNRFHYLNAGAHEFWTCGRDGKMQFFTPAGEIRESEMFPSFPEQVMVPDAP